jgi:hypothetical protein
MSHYYSSCVGGRGKATRAGHKTTGIRAMARCHELSVYVTGAHDPETQEDTFSIHLTLDDDRAVLEGSSQSHVTTVAPLIVKYKGNTHSVEVIHVVGDGETHNVKSSQAVFMADY